MGLISPSDVCGHSNTDLYIRYIELQIELLKAYQNDREPSPETLGELAFVEWELADAQLNINENKLKPSLTSRIFAFASNTLTGSIVAIGLTAQIYTANGNDIENLPRDLVQTIIDIQSSLTGDNQNTSSEIVPNPE